MKEILNQRFSEVDFDDARKDVFSFLGEKDRENLSLWDKEFFIDITDRYLK